MSRVVGVHYPEALGDAPASGRRKDWHASQKHERRQRLATVCRLLDYPVWSAARDTVAARYPPDQHVLAVAREILGMHDVYKYT